MAAAASKPSKTAEQTAERRDPTPRPVDAELPYMRLANKDERFKYVAAYEVGHDVNSVNFYKSIGYEIVPTPSPDRERTETHFLAGSDSKPGEPLRQMGHVLMRISVEKHRDIERYGAYGSGGQEHADLIERQLRDQAEARGFVNQHNRGDREYFRFQNKTRAAMPLGQDEALGDVRFGDSAGEE